MVMELFSSLKIMQKISDMKVNGEWDRCMEKERCNGRMDHHMKGIINRVRNMDLVDLFSHQNHAIRDPGRMVNNKEQVEYLIVVDNNKRLGYLNWVNL